MNIKIMIASHEACDVPASSLYMPIQVGSYGKPSIGFLRDDTSENISSLNPKYCELTGLYWCWKNLDCDYLGLVHYRRYFTVASKRERKNKDPLDCVLTQSQTERLLKGHKVLVPKKRKYYIETIYQHYADTFDHTHLDLTREIIQRQCPEYLKSFDKYMKQKEGYILNMFVMPKGLADDYCNWLFPILKELDRKVDSSEYSAFELRYLGRVSERLFNVWLDRKVKEGILKRDEIKEVPYLYIGEVNWTRKITGFLGAKFLHKKYDRSF